MVPIVAGLLMGAAMGGGIAALQKKDVLQGALMGGVGGALGGAFMPGVAGTVGGEAVGAGIGGEALGAGLGTPGILGGGGEALASAATQATASGAGTGSGLFGASGGIGNFLSQNKYALAGGALGGMMAPGQEPDPADQGNIYTTQFSQDVNPNFGAPGESYFTNQAYAPGIFSPVKDYQPTQMAANGGIIALAEGGQPGLEMQRYSQPVRQMSPEVAAYNQQMMERANQQYNINPRPGPMQVPGSAGYMAPTPRAAAPAPAGDSISGLRFNPLTQQFEGEFNAPGSKKKSNYDFDELDERYGRPDFFTHASSNEGGANGGMPGVDFAAGGISSLGAYSDGGQLLKGPGNGTSDSIPAIIGERQPARLADGEFVVPSRIVSELGNGSTDAGAKQLYAMMDRVQKARNKTVGKGKVAVDAKARNLLPA
jgi:hypothetical protein